MIDIWTFLAFQVLAVVSGVATGGLILLVGGMGGLSALARRQVVAEQRIEDVDVRITSEVKKRAGETAQKARAKSRSAQDEVDEVLAQANGGQPSLPLAKARKKPSVVGSRG